MQDVHALHPDFGRLADNRLDRHALGLKVPVGIGRDAQFDPSSSRGLEAGRGTEAGPTPNQADGGQERSTGLFHAFKSF